jgi:hypothetical protein
VQGLADIFVTLFMPFESPEVRSLTSKFSRLSITLPLKQALVDMAAVEGPYETLKGNPASKGQTAI